MKLVPFHDGYDWCVELMGFRMRFDGVADADQYAKALTCAITETGKQVLKSAEPLVAACRRIVETFDASDSMSGAVDVYCVSAMDASRLRQMVALYDNAETP